MAEAKKTRKAKILLTAKKEGLADVKMEWTDSIKWSFISQYGQEWVTTLEENQRADGKGNDGIDIAFTLEVKEKVETIKTDDLGTLHGISATLGKAQDDKMVVAGHTSLTISSVKKYVRFISNNLNAKEDPTKFFIYPSNMDDAIQVSKKEWFRILEGMKSDTGFISKNSYDDKNEGVQIVHHADRNEIEISL